MSMAVEAADSKEQKSTPITEKVLELGTESLGYRLWGYLRHCI